MALLRNISLQKWLFFSLLIVLTSIQMSLTTKKDHIHRASPPSPSRPSPPPPLPPTPKRGTLLESLRFLSTKKDHYRLPAPPPPPPQRELSHHLRNFSLTMRNFSLTVRSSGEQSSSSKDHQSAMRQRQSKIESSDHGGIGTALEMHKPEHALHKHKAKSMLIEKHPMGLTVAMDKKRSMSMSMPGELERRKKQKEEPIDKKTSMTNIKQLPPLPPPPPPPPKRRGTLFGKWRKSEEVALERRTQKEELISRNPTVINVLRNGMSQWKEKKTLRNAANMISDWWKNRKLIAEQKRIASEKRIAAAIKNPAVKNVVHMAEVARAAMRRRKLIGSYCRPESYASLINEQLDHGQSNEQEQEDGKLPLSEAADEEKKKKFQLKSAIRLAMRSFLCDQILWKEENAKNEEKNESKADEPKWTFNQIVEEGETKLDGKEGRTSADGQKLFFSKLEFYERSFVNTDSHLAHRFASDFKFTVYYPKEFSALWKLFNVDPLNLLISLTKKELKGFVNPMDSTSIFLQSADKKFFFKTIQQKRKNNFIFKFLNPLVEQDFFFTEHQQTQLNERFRIGSSAGGKKTLSRSFSKKPSFGSSKGDGNPSAEEKPSFDGGFAQYFEYIRQIG